ncbi:MAG: hypothetical protein FD161_3191 [Limisphaerales bacterium]|nr:MAG: hypothetical protein FD161_3191 [Limisphaerales bacterium]KAG0507983.1 MAG: hypothetical protein E1N63_2857 [Limisphaerales bacterium]TXT48089.1 MAG: hypothetical protein FD140_3752 [Limisphaerales bacterium]
METFLALLVGIGLSAACGFRVFVPMLVVSAAAWGGWMPLAPGFEWLGTLPALIAFAVATAVEVAAYYVPWVDNALDTVAGPVAMVAGTVLMASVITDVNPFLKWTLAIIAGGGTAATVQGMTTLARAGSSALSLGFLNPVLSTVELVGSTGLAILAIAVPVVALLVVIGLGVLVVKLVGRARTGKTAQAAN